MRHDKVRIIRPLSMGRENQMVVLNEIRANSPISRSQIASDTGLSKPSVARAVEMLLKEGLILESDPLENHCELGRKPRGLIFNNKAGFFQSVDIGGTKITFALGDLSGEIIKIHTIKNACRHWDEMVQLISWGIQDFFDTAKVPLEKAKGVAIGAQGVVDIEKATVTSAPNIEDPEEYPLGQELKRYIPIPIWIENDVNLGAIGEFWKRQRKHKNIVYVSLGTVIGGALIIEGQLYRGDSYYAGEVGWFIPSKDHLFKNSGKFGCLESLATGPALVKKAESMVQRVSSRDDVLSSDDTITPQKIFSAYEQGSDVARKVANEWIEDLGITLCNISSLLNPELIILGGGLTRSGSSFLDKLKEILEWGTQVPPEIEISDLKEKACLYGGLRLCLDRYLAEYAAGENLSHRDEVEAF